MRTDYRLAHKGPIGAVMTSILKLEAFPPPVDDPGDVAQHKLEGEPPATAGEYEMVVGRAQIASWLFISLIAVAVCSSLAYIGGQAIAQKKIAAPVSTPVSSPATVSSPAALPQTASLVPSQPGPGSISTSSQKPVQPLFAEPEIGKVYLQVGAVQRGLAGIIAEGLRSHGFNSFVAPGPNDKLFRVLVGPLPDPAAFREAMVTVNDLDLAIFARKYQE